MGAQSEGMAVFIGDCGGFRASESRDFAGRRPAFWCRKGATWGITKKEFFAPSKKAVFLHFFEKRLKTLVLINKYGHFIKIAFFVFVPKQVENRVKINIVSNLP